MQPLVHPSSDTSSPPHPVVRLPREFCCTLSTPLPQIRHPGSHRSSSPSSSLHPAFHHLSRQPSSSNHVTKVPELPFSDDFVEGLYLSAGPGDLAHNPLIGVERNLQLLIIEICNANNYLSPESMKDMLFKIVAIITWEVITFHNCQKFFHKIR